MAAPKKEVFFLYDSGTGAPLGGQAGSLSFSVYKDDLGVDLAQPGFQEIAPGVYAFTVTFADPARGVVYLINSGPGAIPAFWGRYARPTDWNDDNADTPLAALGAAIQANIDDVDTNVTNGREFNEGKWEVKISGPDANRLIIYAPNGVTVLKKFNLFDSAGAPTTVNPYKRDPV